MLGINTWWLRWEYRRAVDKFQVAAARLLPRWLVYRAAIRLGAYATTGRYNTQNVPELYFIDALQRWEK